MTIAVTERDMKNELLRDIENMDEVMSRTVHRCDIWQDRCVYWIAKAVRDLLLWAVKREVKR